MPVIEQNFAVTQEIVLFKSGRCQDRFRVEEAGKLRKQGFTLEIEVSKQRVTISQGEFCFKSRSGPETGVCVCTFSKMSWIWDSPFCSSSVALGAMLELVENCE